MTVNHRPLDISTTRALGRLPRSTATILALLSALILAGGLQAIGPSAAAAATTLTEAGSGETSASSSGPSETTAPNTGATEMSDSGTANSEASTETPVPEPSTSEVPAETPATTETPTEAPAETPPPEDPVELPVETIVEEVVETIVETPVPEIPVETLLPTPTPEIPVEAPVSKPVTVETLPPHAAIEDGGASQASLFSSQETPTPGETAGEPAPAAPSDLIGVITAPPTVGGPPPSLGAAEASMGTPRSLAARRLADEVSCELSSMSDSCTVAWLSRQGVISTSSTYVTATAASLSATTAGTDDDAADSDEGSSTLANRPLGPSPGPAPSGASGGSGVGGSGVAPSAFFSLAGQLRLAGPRAQRRLRLSCRPWLTAFFVLIPERPG
jgi:hypothetical protein